MSLPATTFHTLIVTPRLQSFRIPICFLTFTPGPVMSNRLLLTVAIALATFVVPCFAQDHCSTDALSKNANRVLALQSELRKTTVEEMDDAVPPSVSVQMTQLKEALSRFSDATISCAKPSIDPAVLQQQLVELLHANAPEPASGSVISNSDHRYDEVLGSYGHNLRVQVSRPAEIPGFLVIQYSVNIECGYDTMLLVFELQDNQWKQRLRWQASPLKTIGEAFGDFFVFGFLQNPSSAEWRVVVAHGGPWCSSRLSGFQLDLLAPSSDPISPRVLWHTARGYSRGDFDPRLKSSANEFELRLNDDCMSFDADHCFEFRVVYRYMLDAEGHVHRVNPLALNARGFVEEWLTAPWAEAQEVSAAGSVNALEKIHEQFDKAPKPGGGDYVTHSFGPVRACAAPGTFQVQIDSTLQQMVPGKPGGESKGLPSYFFHVREIRNGYLMLSTTTEPDPTCVGPNLMPTKD
jgi:hypothetical protein